LLLVATVRSFAHMPLGISDRNSTPPEHCLQRPLHSVKCTAWVVISKHGIIGPFWFEDDNRELCPPDPNVPAAPGSSFGAHFLSASDRKSFCSTDLKLGDVCYTGLT